MNSVGIESPATDDLDIVDMHILAGHRIDIIDQRIPEGNAVDLDIFTADKIDRELATDVVDRPVIIIYVSLVKHSLKVLAIIENTSAEDLDVFNVHTENRCIDHRPLVDEESLTALEI